VLTDLIKFGFN